MLARARHCRRAFSTRNNNWRASSLKGGDSFKQREGQRDKSSTAPTAVKVTKEIMQTFKELNVKTRVNAQNYLEVRECYLCDKPRKSNADNLWKLNVRPDGSFYCFRCSCGGNYQELKDRLRAFDWESVSPPPSPSAAGRSVSERAKTITANKDKEEEDESVFRRERDSPREKWLLPVQRSVDSYFFNLFPSAPSVSVSVAEDTSAVSDSLSLSVSLTHTGGDNGDQTTASPQIDAKSNNSNKGNDSSVTNSNNNNSTNGNSSDAFAAQREIVKRYLNETRGLSDDVLRRYRVGCTAQQFLNEREEWQDQLCVTFPWIYPAEQVSADRFASPAILAQRHQTAPAHSTHVPSSSSAKRREAVTEGSVGFIEPAVQLLQTPPSSISPMDSPTESESAADNSAASLFYHVRVKYRAVQTKGLQRILPKGGAWGFFGWHTVRDYLLSHSENSGAHSNTRPSSSALSPRRSIIITEGEYDAMAVAQGLLSLPEGDPLRGVPAISLPNGCNSLPTELVGMLDDFDRIYLWMDFDKSGQEACEKFVRKLGMARCLVVKPLPDRPNPPKDANDALRQGDSTLIPQMLRAAQPLAHERIESFASMRHALQQRLATGEIVDGSGTLSLPGLTKITKGFRRGELVVLSGPTGSGKTTLCSQLSIDFASAGKPVLWGSFEVKNMQLSEKMVHQFAKMSLPLRDVPQATLNPILDDFQALPIQFMNFYGATDVEKLFDTMESIVDKYDIQHVFIDNLQFLLPRNFSSPAKANNNSKAFFDRYEQQDQVFDRFRHFATSKKVNVVLVVHPRKEENFTLGLSSIGGSAKCSQEADVVMILQNPTFGGQVALDVRKNRYDGFLGRLLLQFNPVNRLLAQVSDVISFEERPFTPNHANNKNSSSNNGTKSAQAINEVVSSRLMLTAKEVWQTKYGDSKNNNDDNASTAVVPEETDPPTQSQALPPAEEPKRKRKSKKSAEESPTN